MQLQNKTLLFLGDSITEGYGASDGSKCFVSLIAAAHPTAKVYNFGVGGTRFARQKIPTEPTYEYPFYTRVEGMEKNADAICVFGGTNDFGHGDAAMGTLGDDTPNTFYGALRVLSEKLLLKYPDAKIAYFTPLHCLRENVPAKRPDGEWILADYVTAIRRNAEYFSFPVLDLWRVSGIQPSVPEIRERFMPDGLHPNDAGYARLFSVVNSFLSAL